jgi:uncharacterized membrane protein
VLGLFWVIHHRLFRLIIRSDFTLLWLNLLLLMCIAFLPFPTELMAEYPQHQFSIVFYASSMAVTGLVLAALWFYTREFSSRVSMNCLLPEPLSAGQFVG